jgi:RNA polymerase sigma factor (sigma-70 family)
MTSKIDKGVKHGEHDYDEQRTDQEMQPIEKDYKEHGTGVQKYASKVTNSHEMGEDVKQDVFAALIERTRKNQEAILKLKNYRGRTAHNMALDAQQRLKKERGESLDDAENVGVRNEAADRRSAPAIIERVEKDEILRLCMADAAPEERQAFAMWIAGYSRKEMAEHMNIDEGIAKVMVNRFMARLRHRLSRY